MELLKVLGSLAGLAPGMGPHGDDPDGGAAFRRTLDGALTRRANTGREPAEASDAAADRVRRPQEATAESEAPEAPAELEAPQALAAPSATDPEPKAAAELTNGPEDEDPANNEQADETLAVTAAPPAPAEDLSPLLAMLLGGVPDTGVKGEPAAVTPAPEAASAGVGDASATPAPPMGNAAATPRLPSLEGAPPNGGQSLHPAEPSLVDAAPPRPGTPSLDGKARRSLRPGPELNPQGPVEGPGATSKAGAGARVAALQSALLGSRRAARGASADEARDPEVVDAARAAVSGREAAFAPARPDRAATPVSRESDVATAAVSEAPDLGETPPTTPPAPAKAAKSEGKPAQAADAAPARESGSPESAPTNRGAETLLQSGAELRATEGKAESSARPPSATTPLPASLRPAELPERSVHLLRELRQNGEDSYRASLRLDPPALGKLRIEVQMDGDRSWTRLTVESHAAREHLQAELPRIRALMEQQGLGEARVEVQLRQGGGQHSQSDGQGPRTGGQAPGAETASEEPGASAWTRHDGLIDLRA